MSTPKNTPQPVEFNWAHYVQVELRQRQILEQLEASLKEAEALASGAAVPVKKGWTRLFSSSQTASADKRQAEVTIAMVQKRRVEVEKVLEDNHKELHSKLHAWLSIKDERYRMAAEVERKHRAVAEAIAPMPAQFLEMRTRYGCARTEIGVAYDQATGTLSPVGQASVDRLIASYDALIESEQRLVDALTALNTLVEGTMFVRLRLAEFRMALAPECKPGMPYLEMRANFEKGAEQVNDAIDDLEGYVLRLKRVDYDRDEILREYREAEWKRRLFIMAAESDQ